MSEKNGIAIAGTILVDQINEISAYPNAGELTQIRNVSKAVGGCVPNVAIDLARIDPKLSVKAVGKIGNDDSGAFLKKVLGENGVNTDGLVTSEIPTSFTQVMSIIGGQRTFFTYAGACADFGADDVDVDTLNVKMLHIGYFLLLDKIDNGDGIKLLKKATEVGIKTSIDLVSENSDRYSMILPCLPYTDNLIINELEAGQLTGIEPKCENLRVIAEKLKALGVRERVIIHMKDRGVCLSNNGYTVLGAYDVPREWIKGTTGAGDAFCAGALLGIYREMSDEDILDLASASAIAALSAPDAISGMRSERELYELCKNVKRYEICL
jgi:sugar/nucleoside kinase (ribokinase family)